MQLVLESKVIFHCSSTDTILLSVPLVLFNVSISQLIIHASDACKVWVINYVHLVLRVAFILLRLLTNQPTPVPVMWSVRTVLNETWWLTDGRIGWRASHGPPSSLLLPFETSPPRCRSTRLCTVIRRWVWRVLSVIVSIAVSLIVCIDEKEMTKCLLLTFD